MFYSSKGPLGSVLVAAYCHKKLKKNQVNLTNIPFSVDKILLNGTPVVTYRVLGYLLLGVVRIYLKKVEYLFDDCHDVWSKIEKSLISEKIDEGKDTHIANCIGRPISYNLDAFDFGVLEDEVNKHRLIEIDGVFNETEEEYSELVPSFCEEREKLVQKLTYPDIEMFCGDEGELPDITIDTDYDQLKCTEMTPEFENKEMDATTESKLQENSKKDASPESILPGASSATTPEITVIPTPADKEPIRTLRKRKCPETTSPKETID